MKKEILNFIREKRKEQGFTQAEIGNILGMKASSYGDIENGITNFKLDDFLIVCQKLNIDPVHLVKQSDQIIIVLDRDQAEMIDDINNQIQNQIRLNNVNIATDGGDIIFGTQINQKKRLKK